MTPWERVVAVTEKHNIDRVTVDLDEGRSWTYVRCDCGESFSERWEFTDHIRRLTFDAVKPSLVSPEGER